MPRRPTRSRGQRAMCAIVERRNRLGGCRSMTSLGVSSSVDGTPCASHGERCCYSHPPAREAHRSGAGSPRRARSRRRRTRRRRRRPRSCGRRRGGRRHRPARSCGRCSGGGAARGMVRDPAVRTTNDGPGCSCQPVEPLAARVAFTKARSVGWVAANLSPASRSGRELAGRPSSQELRSEPGGRSGHRRSGSERDERHQSDRCRCLEPHHVCPFMSSRSTCARRSRLFRRFPPRSSLVDQAQEPCRRSGHGESMLRKSNVTSPGSPRLARVLVDNTSKPAVLHPDVRPHHGVALDAFVGDGRRW